MKEFEYKKEYFSSNAIQIINKLLEKDLDDEILNIITQVNKEEEMSVFSANELEQVLIAVKNKLSTEQIKFFLVNKDGDSLYNHGQMQAIRVGFREGLTAEEINIYAKLNKDGNPIYNDAQMLEIQYALTDKMPVDNIMLFAKLNENEEPIYDEDQMLQIRTGFISKIPIEYILLYSQLKDGKPMFNAEEMYNIKHFLRYRDTNAIKQLKECIDKELTFKQLKPLLSGIPAENIRILSSFYNLGCTVESVESLIKSKMLYQELKDIKYFLQCAKYTGVGVNSVITFSRSNYNEMRGCAASLICLSREISDPDSHMVIKRCLSYKMPHEQIDFLTQPEYHLSCNEMKVVAAGFLNGIDINEMKNIVLGAKINNSISIELIRTDIELVIANKINSGFNLDEEINLTTECFDDYENRGV